MVGARMQRNRGGAVGAGSGVSPGTWFALGFVLGPWCWMIGGWMMGGGRTRVAADAEKGVDRRQGDDAWMRRCRIAAVLSGVAVLGGALAAVVYAVIGAR